MNKKRVYKKFKPVLNLVVNCKLLNHNNTFIRPK